MDLTWVRAAGDAKAFSSPLANATSFLLTDKVAEKVQPRRALGLRLELWSQACPRTPNRPCVYMMAHSSVRDLSEIAQIDLVTLRSGCRFTVGPQAHRLR